MYKRQILLPMESFDMETYTDAYLLFEGASQLMTYSDAYEQLVEERTDQLEPLSKERAQLRGDSIRDEAQEEIDKAKQEQMCIRDSHRATFIYK